MSLDVETVTSATMHVFSWLDSIAETGPSHAHPFSPTWTEVHYKEHADQPVVLYVDLTSTASALTVGSLGVLVPSSPAIETLMTEGMVQTLLDIPQTVSWISSDPGTERYEGGETSTTSQERPQEVDEGFEALFESAKEQIFEDGMESEFSTGLISLIQKYGNDAIMVLTQIVVDEKADAEVTSEALRWLGQFKDSTTYSYRLWLLERSLRCSSERVRDSAALGLAYLDDPNAIPYLKRAIEEEQIGELRMDMEQALGQLGSKS